MPRLPRKRAAGPHGAQARHQTQPSPISTTPATQNDGGCRQVPRLPHETTADVTKCRACCAKLYVTKLCVTKLCVTMTKLCLTKLYVTKLCACDKVVCDKFVCDKVACDKVVCDNLYVTKLCV